MDFFSPRLAFWGRKLRLKEKKERRRDQACGLGVVPLATISDSPKASAWVAGPGNTSNEARTTTGEVLEPLLMEADSSPQSSYVSDVLRPLLAEMVTQVLTSCPADPTVFFLTWLLRRLVGRVPEDASKPLFRWLDDHALSENVSPEFDSEKRSVLQLRDEKLSSQRPASAEPPKVASGSGVRFIPSPVSPQSTNAPNENVIASARSSCASSTSQKAHHGILKSKTSPDLEQGGRPPRMCRRLTFEEDAEKTSTQADSTPMDSPVHVSEGSQNSGALDRSRSSVLSSGSDDDGKEDEDEFPDAPAPLESVTYARRHRSSSTDNSAHDMKAFEAMLAGKNDEAKNRRASCYRRRTSHYQGNAPIHMAKVLETIRKIPLFQSFPEDELRRIACNFEMRCFEAEAEVVRWGNKGGDLHIIQAGKACISVPQQIDSLKPDEWFGEENVLKSHVPSPHRISAGDSPLITLCLPSEKFQLMNLAKSLTRRSNSKVIGKVQMRQENRDSQLSAHGMGNRMSYLPGGISMIPADTIQKTPSGFVDDAVLCGQAPIETGMWMLGILEYAEDLEKSVDDLKLITDGIRENGYLMEILHLTDDQVDVIAQEVVLFEVPMNGQLCRDGEACTSLFIVHDGLLQVQESKVERKIRIGESFGELGLLYGTPCKGTVSALRRTDVWELKHDAFRRVLKIKSASRLEEYMSLLESASLFNSLAQINQEIIADALEEVFYTRGEDVVEAGSTVEKVSIIFDGSVRVGEGSDAPELTRGAFFGLKEMAKSKTQKKRIHVVSEKATLLTLDRDSLELLTEMPAEVLLAKIESAGEGQPSQQRGSTRGEEVRAGSNTRRDSIEVFRCHHLLATSDIKKERLKHIGTLGAGSFGTVTLVEDPETSTMYAMKSLSKGFIVQMGMQKATMREKRMHAMLDSPFIVKLFATFKDAHSLHLLLQPAMGGELFDLYMDHEDWFGNSRYAQFFGAGAALGLDHMHSKKVIYRDLKLENMLMDGEGRTLLADMGLAKVVCGKTYTVCGTADYMAPEVLRRSGHNRGVDWWAFGILVFIMMSGRSPFDASNASEIYRNVVKGLKKAHYPDTFDKDLVDLIGGLCRKKPEERLTMGPQGVKALREAPWFKSFNWETFVERKMKPPWRPTVKTREEIEAHAVEEPPVVPCEDDQTDWDAEF